MKKYKFPIGWDEEKVKKVIAFYENQTEEEALAEDEEAYKDITHTMFEVPIELVPEIRQLVAKYQTARLRNIVADKED